MMRQLASLLLFTVTMSAADLPVREVVLFKHGVGYFARSGHLAAGESARLDFKAEEMNDVLKSLTVEEKGGGKISGLRYDSSEPLAKKLEEFPFAIGSQQPLSAVLDQLKGARVELKFGTETVAGAIVGARRLAGGQNQPEHEQATLLLDSGELRNVDLGAISSLRFSDPKLQLQFKDYLAAIAQSRSKDKRSVYIDSSDSGAREIQASYMIPSPVWKSSYRLIFGESGQPTLEGWAIVDNTTGDDWTNVRLALVSGRPISFVSRLYEPRYVGRPEAELAEDQALAPVVDTGALDEEKDQKEASPVNGRRDLERFARLQKAPPPPPAPARVMAPQSGPGGVIGGFGGGVAADQLSATPSSISQTAAAQELGELFEYRISTPVTIRKSESAMLPFLQDKIAARKLLIYSDESSAHPLNAAEISNSTGKTLDGGPITVFDAGTYGGEALMETVKTGDKRLLSYAVDLGTRITTKFDSKAAVVREIHVNRGLLTTKSAAVETKTYTIRNVDQKAKTLIIEHPARPGYTLLERKPSEKTANAYRFEVKLASDATEKFAVTEENVFDSTIAVSSLSPDVLAGYISNKNLSDAGRKQLADILDRKRQIAAADSEKQRVTERINALDHDQNRIRQNIDSLNRVPGQQEQVQKYAKQLADQEGQLATLRDRQSELDRKKAALQSEMNSLIEKMEF
ncbi:MAG TPA: DUF4139 domain-containing protein [Bryobacteraceae bacterium]|nr:DUF4139 domain-containing protein [Bryobacteraceae bacterium]